MNAAVTEVLSALIAAGYRLIGKEVGVSGVPFRFDGVLEDGLHLVLVEQVGATTDAQARFRWQVERVARTLDVSASRRVISVVAIAAGPLKPDLLAALSRVARVITCESSMGTERLRSRLQPLLPLVISPQSAKAREVTSLLASQQTNDHLRVLVTHASSGESAVRTAFRQFLDSAFEGTE